MTTVYGKECERGGLGRTRRVTPPRGLLLASPGKVAAGKAESALGGFKKNPKNLLSARRGNTVAALSPARGLGVRPLSVSLRRCA